MCKITVNLIKKSWFYGYL